jgi:hypothetical protein
VRQPSSSAAWEEPEQFAGEMRAALKITAMIPPGRANNR